MTKTLDALSTELASLSHLQATGEFWVLRSRSQILTRARAMIAEAHQRICFSLPQEYDVELADEVMAAQRRNCSLIRRSSTARTDEERHIILLLVDDQKGLAGILTPAERCQAVVSENAGLLAPLRSYFTRSLSVETPLTKTSNGGGATSQENSLSWIAWEDRKQRRLWSSEKDNRVA
jgi:hypothetical protein